MDYGRVRDSRVVQVLMTGVKAILLEDLLLVDANLRKARYRQ